MIFYLIVLKSLVATNAFGMGFDLGNVRFVIHYNMPNIQPDHQRAGCAGRDALKSE